MKNPCSYHTVNASALISRFNDTKWFGMASFQDAAMPLG
jgi:hypothetical protein